MFSWHYNHMEVCKVILPNIIQFNRGIEARGRHYIMFK